jgi:hypothetical protein
MAGRGGFLPLLPTHKKHDQAHHGHTHGAVNHFFLVLLGPGVGLPKSRQLCCV